MTQDLRELDTDIPTRNTVRRLRGFVASFESQIESTAAQTGITFDLTPDRLSAAFLEWMTAFEAQKPKNPDEKMPYVGFASGLMLRSLLTVEPVQVVDLPKGADLDQPAYFWPEGHLYVSYCLNIRGCVLEEDFHEPQSTVQEFSDVRTWWSFRENVRENPSSAIAFLDLFSGQEPEWSMPSVFRADRFKALARQSYKSIS